jgi:hypothetical protein
MLTEYATPANAARDRALTFEDRAMRLLSAADWSADCGDTDTAVSAYRRCAQAFTRAAELRAEAAALPGGHELDRRTIGWNYDAAERANAEADHLLYGNSEVTA